MVKLEQFRKYDLLVNPPFLLTLKDHMMNRTLAPLLAAIGIAAYAPASAIVVGVVDFGTLGANPGKTIWKRRRLPKP